jgi:hypothetical protein
MAPFNQESATIVLPSSDLELRGAGADSLLRVTLEEAIQQLKGSLGSEFSDDIRNRLLSFCSSKAQSR